MFDGPGCPVSCLTIDGDDNCTEPSQEGCFCKNGYVLSGNKCVPKSQCGCIERNEDNVQYFPVSILLYPIYESGLKQYMF